MKNLLLALSLLIAISLQAQGDREFTLKFDYRFTSNDPVVFGSSQHLNDDSAKIVFDQASFYLSNVKLYTTTDTVAFDTVFLVTANTDTLSFGQIPVGNYQFMTYNIGLDSAINHADPSLYPSSHPLALQVPSMHWSWNSGYIFARIEGTIDTSADNSTGFDVPFEYHLGGDNYKPRVVSNILKDVTNLTQQLHVDVSMLLEMVVDSFDLKNGVDVSTHTMDNVPLAEKLAYNLHASWLVDVSTVDLPTSISEIDNEEAFQLYPNPMASNATLDIRTQGKYTQVQVVDIAGKTIFTQALDGNTLQLQRSQFPSAGVYMVKVSGENVAVRKLVVY